MIKNKTIYSKQDYLFVTKLQRFKPIKVICDLALILCSLYLISLAIPFLKERLIDNISLNLNETCYMLVCLLFGFVAIAFVFVKEYLMANIAYKKSGGEKSVEVEFSENHFIIKQSVAGISSESSLEYSIVRGYIEKNNAVYILFNVGKKKGCVILHDDTYLEGNKEELIKLLTSKKVNQVSG